MLLLKCGSRGWPSSSPVGDGVEVGLVAGDGGFLWAGIVADEPVGAFVAFPPRGCGAELKNTSTLESRGWGAGGGGASTRPQCWPRLGR